MKKIIVSCMVLLLILCGCSDDSLVQSGQYQYYYASLKEDEKQAYLEIYNAILNYEDSVIIKNVEKEMLKTLYVMVQDDHPELFYMDKKFSFTSLFGGKQFEISFSYLMEADEAKKTQTQIEDASKIILDKISDDMDVFTKVRMIYEYVIENVQYVDEAINDQNIQSVFITKESVCAGYARAIQYLCLKAGIDCTYIEGHGKKGDSEVRHAWNMLYLEGDYYYMDATWGDKVDHLTHACDAYFLMDSEEMLQNYEPESMYEKTKDTSKKWYVENGSYFTKWDAAQIKALWKKAASKKQMYIEMKCTPEVFVEIVKRIEEKGEMYEILRQEGIFVDSLWCSKNEALHTIEIFY